MSFVVSQRLLTQQFQDMCRMVASHWSGSSFTKCIASLRQDIMRCKKCGSHSASIWVDMHPPCIAPNNLAEIPAIILASKKIAGWMTSTYPRSRLQNDQWQGVSWPIMVYGTCKADVEVKAVTWCCWWFGVVTEIIHRLESKWLFFRTFNDWGFICHLKPHTWVHSCPLCTCTLTHRWKDHVESYKLWRSSPSCLSMRLWPGQELLVAACWLLGPDLLLP